ncbi:hypothetical protein SAMN05216228_104620 [Rhizobium tibeticum]|uniref:Uncharacterized protein n=1 Tax=Rhizobium tibeticum TaxID=501024 RepID=A0A1H8VSD7_9HYPH|nr:hypothetical protein RTCCBAU85039_6163 [Rhizobium tibeticum]SEP17848.1 hypothetical protein SAMN05216228_104620 [Rhizobium tibeticum]
MFPAKGLGIKTRAIYFGRRFRRSQKSQKVGGGNSRRSASSFAGTNFTH